jgi:hypothetical protein
MSVKNTNPRKGVVQPTRSVWVLAATLIAALLLGSFGAATRVAAQGSVALPSADRSADLAGYQAQAPATLAYTDLYRFYANRSIAQGKQTASPLPYADLSQFYVERMTGQSIPELAGYHAQGSVALPSADRSADLEGYQAQAPATLAYTDVYRFYADRSIAQGKQIASPLPYADLSQFYVERMTGQSTLVCSAVSC